jgi:phospholipase A-2-activating protein
VSHVEAITQVLERWPSSQRFPVIDLSRLVIGFSPDAYGARRKLLDALFVAAEWDLPWEAPLPKPRETNILLTLKALANVFQAGVTLGDELGWILSRLEKAPYEVLGKTQWSAYASVLFK